MVVDRTGALEPGAGYVLKFFGRGVPWSCLLVEAGFPVCLFFVPVALCASHLKHQNIARDRSGKRILQEIPPRLPLRPSPVCVMGCS